MKAKFYFFIGLIAMVAVIFSSCKKDDDTPPQSQAKFGADKTTAMVNEVIQFTNSSENATAFAWSFGDGTTSAAVSPKKAYTDVGAYLVTLVSTGAGGSTIQNINITIVPAVGFSVEEPENLFTNTPVEFTNSSIGATSYLWEFGDAENSTSDEENPTFTYSAGGTYTVTLTAISDEGESSVSKEVDINASDDISEIYFINGSDELMQKLALDGSAAVSSFLDLSGKWGVGLAYDEANSKIYYSDFYDDDTPNGKIWRVNIDGSGMEELVSGIDDPYGIALDKVNQKIYWVDDAGNVSRSNLDGSSPEIGIVNVEDGQMRAVDLDVENNKMYFYEVYAEDLYVADLDGSNVSVIIPGVYGYGLKIDALNGKIYFDDQNTNTIIRANLDGSGQETIDTNVPRTYGFAIDHDENVIYWSKSSDGEILKANLDGSDMEVLATGLGSPRGIFLRK